MKSAKTLVSLALRSIPPPSASGSTIHLALSGGVDSSVAAFLLRERGWRVRPIFLRCWTSDDGACVERELRAAQAAVHALQLGDPLDDWDFVREYWNGVFEGVLLRGLADGLTPNPDVACNALIKFGSFPERLRKESGNESIQFATGHYARLNSNHQLLRAVDTHKDQSYFLAKVKAADLRDAIFPLGNLLKRETRAIATHAGLPAAQAPSSRGLCFVGAPRLTALLDQYMGTSHPSRFVDAETRIPISDAPFAAWAYTIGQRARIGGASNPYYVVGKSKDGDVLVAQGAESHLLRTRQVECSKPHWIHERPVDGSALFAKVNSCGDMLECTTEVRDDTFFVVFKKDVRKVAPGQLIAIYDGEVCLGGAVVSGASVSQQRAEMIEDAQQISFVDGT